MRYTNFTAELPTRTTLRETAASAFDAAGDWATTVAVACVAVLAFATSATVVAVALGVALAVMPAHPFGLLATAAVVVVAAHAVPVLALSATGVAVRRLNRRA